MLIETLIAVTYLTRRALPVGIAASAQRSEEECPSHRPTSRYFTAPVVRPAMKSSRKKL